jgi:U3 small nucleolar RNA-associated protein 21
MIFIQFPLKSAAKLEEDHLIMPPIIQFTSETTREKHWDSIVALHNGLTIATLWSFDKRKMGDLKIQPKKFMAKNRKDFRTVASCVNMSHCGNFVVLGYSSGDVERFNIQSGIHRATYGSPAHQTEIRGLWTDNLNQIVISGGTDGLVKFWNFKENTEKEIGRMKMPDSVLMFRGHRESSMLCVALEDFSTLIIDYDTKNVVRRFVGHTAPITDACFSPDSRWLITSSMDCTIRTWDIPSSYLIDQFKMEQPCISLTMSPTGDFLATAHIDFLGVYLWANKSLYEHIALRAIDPEAEPRNMELPNMMDFEHNDVTDMLDAIKIEQDEEGELINTEYKSPAQIDSDLITMSTQAEVKWRNILSLDVIKQRNKPKEAPKKPKQAPFFLPTVAGLDIQFDVDMATENGDGSKLIKSSNFESLTTFGIVLKSAEGGDFTNAISHMINLNPSMIDYEIRALSPLGGGSIGQIRKFLEMIVAMLESNENFELAQAYLALCLKVHEEIISENRELVEILEVVEVKQNESWRNIEEKLFYGIGVVSNLRNFC